MYVCVCNGLREKDIVKALRCEGCTAENVHGNLGCKVSCGACMDYIEGCLESAAEPKSSSVMTSRTIHEAPKD